MTDSSKENNEDKKTFPKKRRIKDTSKDNRQNKSPNTFQKKNNKFQKRDKFEKKEGDSTKSSNRKPSNRNFKKTFSKREEQSNNNTERSKNKNFKKTFSKREEQSNNNTERNKNRNFKKTFSKREEQSNNNTERNRGTSNRKFFDKNQEERQGNVEQKSNSTFKKEGFRKKRNHDYQEKRFKEQKQIDKKYKRPSENTIKKINEKKFRSKKQQTAKNKETTRLNKYIANAGICSRREADVLISQGKITVNDKVITEMGYQVHNDDVVKYGKTVLRKEPLVYVLLNKPKDYITTTDDPQERKIVMELVENACKERIYPVGRLDRNTTGLLLFTNDGDLAKKLSHPSGNISKVYEVGLNKPLTNNDFQQITEGIVLEDGFIQVDDLAIISPDNLMVGLELHSGKNRIVRRIFEHLGYEVLKLDRTSYAGLNKKELPRGNWRFLNEKEIMRLKYFI